MYGEGAFTQVTNTWKGMLMVYSALIMISIFCFYMWNTGVWSESQISSELTVKNVFKTIISNYWVGLIEENVTYGYLLHCRHQNNSFKNSDFIVFYG